MPFNRAWIPDNACLFYAKLNMQSKTMIPILPLSIRTGRSILLIMACLLIGMPLSLYAQEKEAPKSTKKISFKVIGGDGLQRITFEVNPGQDLYGVKADGSTYQILNVEQKTLLMTMGQTYEVLIYRGKDFLGRKELIINASTPSVIDLDLRQLSKPTKEPNNDQIKRLADVTVREKFTRQESTKNIIRREEIKFSPGSGGDPLKALKNLPGVVGTGSAFFEGLYVRGGNQEDVLYTMDGLVIGNPFHTSGFYSVFSAERINKVEFYPSAYPYTFGNSQGAAINITSKGVFAETFKAKLDLNLGVAALDVEMPLIKDKLDFVGSFRRSHYEIYLVIARQIESVADSLDFPAPVFFNNYNNLHWKINDDHDLEISTITKYDFFKIATPFPFEDQEGNEQDVIIDNAFANYWNTTGFVETWKTGYIRNKIMVSRLFERDIIFLFGSTFSEVDRVLWNVHDKAILQLTQWLDLEMGIMYTYEGVEGSNRVFSQEEILSLQQDSLNAPSDYDSVINNIEFFKQGKLIALEDYKRHLLSAYTGINFSISSFLVAPGVFSTYNFQGERFFMDPRVDVIYKIHEDWNLFARMGQYTQIPDFLVLIPEEFPQQNDPKLKNPSTLHFILGNEITLLGTLFKGEGYYQYGFNQVLLNPEFNPSLELDFETNPHTVSTGQNRGYGLEVLIKRPIREKFYGWFTYTFSSAERYEYEEGQTTLRWFTYEQDVQHQVNLLSSWQITQHWRLGGRITCATGKPRTDFLLVFDDLNGNGQIDKGELSYSEDLKHRNEARNPYMFRLDMRLDYTVVLWQKVKLSIYLDIWDLEYVLRQNVTGYTIRRDYLNDEAMDDYSPADFKKGRSPILPTDSLQASPSIPPILPLLGVEISF